MRLAIALLLAGTALLAPATSPAQPVPAAMTLALSAETVVWGEELAAAGAVVGVPPGTEVVVETGSGEDWRPVGSAVTDDTGAFTVAYAPKLSGFVRANVPALGAVSAPLPFTVVPRVEARARLGSAFVGAKVVLRVRPRSWAGRAVLTVRRHGVEVGRTNGRARAGRVRLTAPTPGIGRFNATLELRAADGLGGRTLAFRVRALARTLSPGAEGPEVRALTRRLVDLHFHLPGRSWTYTSTVYDAVIAFQKANGLPRTGVVTEPDWRRLAVATTPRPRYRRPLNHIEVDKARQIVIVVRAGEVAGVLPASTGATGNTPEGAHRVRWKAPATSTWLGPAILYRTLTFYGNSFAIHGFVSVPSYPASHGCVRIPIWAADWLYNQTPVGQRVYVYS